MENERKNLWFALLLSFLVCAAGSVIWGVIYTQGWLVALVAYVSAFCAFLVYEKVYKEVTKGAFIWVLVWTIVLNTVASFLSTVITVSLTAEVSFGVALDAVMQIFGNYVGSFLFDMVLGAVFAGLGVYSYYKYLQRKKQEKKAAEEAKAAIEAAGTKTAQTEDAPAQTTEKEPDATEEKPTNCPKCGAKLKDGSDTCDFCGAKKE